MFCRMNAVNMKVMSEAAGIGNKMYGGMIKVGDGVGSRFGSVIDQCILYFV